MNDHPGEPGPDLERIGTQAAFGRELALMRNRAGLTIRQVARAADLPASTAGDYFSGRHLPASGNPEVLRKILAACGETDPGQIAAWTGALARVRRPPGKRGAARGEAPYRGLASFEQADTRWYSGREDITGRLLELAAEAPAGLPLVVVGPSGSGKSSLLRAGVMPRLDGPAELFVPTATPVADLRPAAGTRYLVIDQGEAIFTRCQDKDQRRAFLDAVRGLAARMTVVVALRADFYDQAPRYPVLAGALGARQVLLAPMTAAQVRRAITEPARLARLEVEDGLVELLLRDLAPRPPGPAAQDPAGHEPGAPAAAVARPAGHLGAQPHGGPDRGRLPRQRRHLRRDHPHG